LLFNMSSFSGYYLVCGAVSGGLADFVRERVGSYVTVVARNGVVYEGLLAGKEHGFLVLKNAVIRGSRWEARVSTVLVSVESIQHIHGPPLELKPLGSTAPSTTPSNTP